jgi:DNA-binding transcriptional ArsR family regulator
MDQALRAVADPTRREILRLVRDDELPAGDIARHFTSMSRPAVSQHLKVLADAGLVDVRPDGNRRLYRSRPEGLRDVAAFLDEMWNDSLSRLKAAAEREEWPERARAELHSDSTDHTDDRPHRDDPPHRHDKEITP